MSDSELRPFLSAMPPRRSNRLRQKQTDPSHHSPAPPTLHSTPTPPSLAGDQIDNAFEALDQTVEDKDTIPYRLLHALLTTAVTEQRASLLAADILSVAEDYGEEGLKKLAEFYIMGLVLKGGGNTPIVSSDPSRGEEIGEGASELAIDWEGAKQDRATLKKYILRRDNYQCVVTGQWDDQAPLFPDGDVDGNPTIAAHILPHSLMTGDHNRVIFNKCTIWTVIQSFTDIRFRELSGDNNNTFSNVFTLTPDIHIYFGSLKIWFEAVLNQENTYVVKRSHPRLLRSQFPLDKVVTFVSNDPRIPLPDPRYLALHAAIARVVHMAGMAEYLNEISRKDDKIRVLSDELALPLLQAKLHEVVRQVSVTA